MVVNSLNSVLDVLKALSDPKVLAIFDLIALSKVDRDFSLSSEPFYQRLSLSCFSFIKNWSHNSEKWKYSVMSFGLLVHHAQNLIGLALNSYWKLSAIDSLESSHIIPRDEYNK